ncbi:D-alanine-D-alanine ligase [bacterium A37T11]|nr:D-alanine-D-alanine ligase [bacterium A37T11]
MGAKIALITGGFTEEAEVSIKSAAFVEDKLKPLSYEVYKIFITNYGWYYEDEKGLKYPIDLRDFHLDLPNGSIFFDLAFIMVHGSPGEDGRLQGYFDMVGLPYTSCDTLTSAVTMNKAYTKLLLAGIDELYMANSVHLHENDRSEAFRLVQEKLVPPYFVKPNAGGSSIGMTKVVDLNGLQPAIDLAFDTANTGKQVIVEDFVSGREFSVGIYRKNGIIHILPPTEILTENEFFDYDAKYNGMSEEITPADLTEEQIERINYLVNEIYVRLNCKGIVRVDFFLEKDTDRFYFIEINTIPGQTPQSFIPQQVRAYGMTETDFYAELIEEALLNKCND